MKHFFNDALTIYINPTRDEYGRENWGTGTAVNGRFVESSKNMYSPQGELITTDALIHVPDDTSIEVGSRVVYDSRNFRVVKLNKPKDISSVRFIKCYLQEYKI